MDILHIVLSMLDLFQRRECMQKHTEQCCRRTFTNQYQVRTTLESLGMAWFAGVWIDLKMTVG